MTGGIVIGEALREPYTPEEFDAECKRQMEKKRPADTTASEMACMFAIGAAFSVDYVAASLVKWEGRRSSKKAFERYRSIALGEVDSKGWGARCGDCAHGVPAVFCPLTHSVFLADRRGAPDDYRCEFEEKENGREI